MRVAKLREVDRLLEMYELISEKQRVTLVIDSSGRREWNCDCADFLRRKKKYGSGFCAHLAMGISLWLHDRNIA
jgi:hypothetical protein